MSALSPQRAALARQWGVATFYEAAGKRGALPAQIKPVADEMFVCGPVYTVAAAPHDNLWLHRALADPAAEGTVLVATVGGAFEAGYWGEIMTAAAQARGVLGLIIDGCVRDRQRLAEMGLPVFARGFCIGGTTKLADAAGGLNVPLRVGDVLVNAGDLIIADADGVVTLPMADVDSVFDSSQARIDHEQTVLQRLAAGESTLAIYGWS